MKDIVNRKAHFNYEILESFTAGIVLTGSEVKAIRNGKITISESFCTIDNNEVFVKNSNISIKESTFFSSNPTRDRKLLLNKTEIKRLKRGVEQKGNTIIPLRLFVNEKGFIKVEIALCRGKKNYDKRETIKERDLERYG